MTYKKLKKQNGEKFAQTIRNFHSGLLEIPDIDVILRHAGRTAEDAQKLLPYLMSLLAANDDTPAAAPQNPFDLLEQAGYEAFHADTLEKQNSIAKYFRKGELLCTFNDAARYKDYHIVHAVKKDVEQIRREDFNGKEERQDAYGTSVISIQMRKAGGFISIKNRYNHTVPNCDNTFSSNPDNIIDGLSSALQGHFNVDVSGSKSAPLPDDVVLMRTQLFKYHQEFHNIYYGDQAWAKDGQIYAVDRAAGDALFEGFLFDNKSKTLKKIDPSSSDSFADDFNMVYDGNRSLTVQDGNLMLDGEILIGAEKSRIKTLYLPALTTMRDHCLQYAIALTQFTAPSLTAMGDKCLHSVPALTQFTTPKLVTMGDGCLWNAHALAQFTAPKLAAMGSNCLTIVSLTQFTAPALTAMKHNCLSRASILTHFTAPVLTTMGNACLEKATALAQFTAPALTTMGDSCLENAPALTHFTAPSLTTMGNECLQNARIKTLDLPALTTMGNFCLINASALTQFTAPVLTTMGTGCLANTYALTQFTAPALSTMNSNCLWEASSLTQFNAPALTAMGNMCLFGATALKEFTAPALATMGNNCLKHTALTQFNAPALTAMGYSCLEEASALTRFNAPMLATMEDHCLLNVPALTQFIAPALTEMGNRSLSGATALTQFTTALDEVPAEISSILAKNGKPLPVQSPKADKSPQKTSRWRRMF